ncbi:Uncharacterized protein DAT39_004211 [Clarias magur]|uniref:Uncharacterized protein n=1 Tax=Clarias magur TaxID=1594786 RepID=A0A8J4UCI4_CLAMG|nr:Uncharacterized protein DAT39_004211 [Clarias magur]
MGAMPAPTSAAERLSRPQQPSMLSRATAAWLFPRWPCQKNAAVVFLQSLVLFPDCVTLLLLRYR